MGRTGVATPYAELEEVDLDGVKIKSASLHNIDYIDLKDIRVGSVVCSQGGHTLTSELLYKIFSDKRNYSLIELKGKNLPHVFINKNNLKSIA